MKEAVRFIEHPEGELRLEFFKSSSTGLFAYTETRKTIDDVPEYGSITYWLPILESGLFASLPDAEHDAYDSIGWLPQLGEQT